MTIYRGFSSTTFYAMILLTALLVLGGCTRVSVDYGQQAVLNAKPFLFGHGGVKPDPVLPGSSIEWLSTDYVIVDMVPEAHDVAFDDFASKDNVLLDLNTVVILQVNDSVKLVSGFGASWFKNNVEGPFGLMARDIVKTQTMPDMMSNPTTATAMDKTVQAQLTDYLKAKGIPVTVVSVTLGRAKPNPTVLNEMNATAAQQQRQKTEVAAAAAETSRAKAETARAEADNAYRQSLGYTTQQYADMQIANIQADACKAAKECILVPAGSPVIANQAK